MTNLERRLRDAVEGKLPYEDLTALELKELERRVMRAIVEKVKNRIAPSTQTRH